MFVITTNSHTVTFQTRRVRGWICRYEARALAKPIADRVRDVEPHFVVKAPGRYVTRKGGRRAARKAFKKYAKQQEWSWE